MKLGKTLYLTHRREWRAWLRENHAREREIWLIYYKKHSGQPRIPYNDAVEEALCYGWIDSTVQRMDEDRTAQRFSPRRPRSFLSETNKERVRRLIRAKKMTRHGLGRIEQQMKQKFTLAADIVAHLKKEAVTWRNFQRFSKTYQRIRVGWIEGARDRPEVFQQRLRYFLKMTAQNKKFGMVQ